LTIHLTELGTICRHDVFRETHCDDHQVAET